MNTDRIQCTLCDTILDMNTEYGQASCNCGNIYLIQEWSSGNIDVKCSRPDAVVFLDDDLYYDDLLGLDLDGLEEDL